MATSDILKERAISAYRALGIPETYVNGQQSFLRLCEMLDHVEPRFAELPYPLSPTSFDPQDSMLRGYPRPIKSTWESAARALKELSSTGVMMRLPLFWQVESPLFAAGQSAGAPIYPSDQINMPLSAAAIRGAGMNTVVTDAEDAMRFSAYLKSSSEPLPAWIIIHAIESKTWTIPPALNDSAVAVYQEVHLLPGIVLLDQCASLAKRKDPIFHISEIFYINVDSQGTLITSTDSTPLPLHQYELPVRLRDAGICSCGKNLYERQDINPTVAR